MLVEIGIGVLRNPGGVGGGAGERLAVQVGGAIDHPGRAIGETVRVVVLLGAVAGQRHAFNQRQHQAG